MYCVPCDDVEYCGFIILHRVGYKGTRGRWASMISEARVDGISVDAVSALVVGLYCVIISFLDIVLM